MGRGDNPEATAFYVDLGEGENKLSILGHRNLTTKTSLYSTNSHSLIKAGDGGNEIFLAEQMKIHIGNGTSASNTIETGSGKDTITVGGMLGTSGSLTQEGHNTINTGAGNDTIKIRGDMAAEQGTKNRIEAGPGEDSIVVTGLMSATKGGSNIIDAGNDSAMDTVEVGGMFAHAGGYTASNQIITGDGGGHIILNGDMTAKQSKTSNTIEMGAIDDLLEIEGTMTSSGGTNTIDTGKGNDTVVLRGGMTAADRSGKNTIETGDGHDKPWH